MRTMDFNSRPHGGRLKKAVLDLVTLIKNLDFSEENYDSIPGKDQEGELHDEFIPDEEGLQEKIIELFYEEV